MSDPTDNTILHQTDVEAALADDIRRAIAEQKALDNATYAPVEMATRAATDLGLTKAGLGMTGITRPVRAPGKLVIGFGAGLWVPNGGAPALTQHTGFDAAGVRTGIVARTQPSMLKWVPASDVAEEIMVTAPTTNLRTPALTGRFGLWVYIENQPGYGPGNVNANLKGTLALTLTTAVGGSNANALFVTFTINQIREGWNFLKFVQRDPTAYLAASGITEYHPFGVAAASVGTGAASDIIASPITSIKIAAANMGGATIYLDSIWTAFDTQAQIVFGVDQATSDTVSIALPMFLAKGWTPFMPVPATIWTTGNRIKTDLNGIGQIGYAKTLYAAGWEVCNHTVNHFPGSTGATTPTMADMTNAAEIAYEVDGSQAIFTGGGLTRGAKFYASPQSQSSRLSEKVIKECGYLLQRHSRKANISVTPWGVDNLHHLGSTDLGSILATGVATVVSGVSGVATGCQQYTKIKRIVDVMEAYGDTWMPFWHTVSTLGDTGSGEDLTGDNVIITASALQKTLDYVATREAAGGLRVRDGLTGFFYGTGR